MTGNIKQPSSTNAWFYAQRGETFRLLAGNTEGPNTNLSQALSCFNNALNEDPNYIWATGRRGVTYRQLANFELAEQDFQTFITKTPSDPWGYAQLGETYRLMLFRSGSTNPESDFAKKAIEKLEKAISLYPEYAWAHAHLGATYYWIQPYKKAKDCLNKAIDLTDRSYAWAFAYLGSVYYKESDYEKAELYWKTAKRLDTRVLPDTAQYDMALLSHLTGRFDEAIEQYNQQLQEKPNDPLALYGIALATIGKNGVDKAKTEIDRTSTRLQEHEHSAAFYMLGSLAYLQGKSDQAQEYLQRATTFRDDLTSKSNETFSILKRSLAVNDLSWLGLDNDERFQSLISPVRKA